MLVADRGADAPLAGNTVTFTDSVGYKGGGYDKVSRRVTNLDDTSLDFDEQNNDDVERIARRRSRLLEPHPEVVNSPAHDAARRAAATQFLPRAQVGEHYGNCIRLAAENKITYKNAFDLHLIDFMGEMIKKEDFTSFRMASSSLDASAKIYAGRVDAVHQETYKVLTGLGRSDSKTTKTGTDGDDPRTLDGVNDSVDELGSGVAVNDRKRRERKRAPNIKPVIVTTLSKIRSRIKAFEAEVDPLFQQQAAAYDDGGIVELRLNRLRTYSKFSELLQDSGTPLFNLREEAGSLTCCTQPVDLYPIFDSHTLEAPLCLAFDDFHFNKLNDETRAHIAPLSPLFVQEAYDSATTTPIPLASPPQMDIDDDNTAFPIPDTDGDDFEVTLVNEGNVKSGNKDGVQVIDAVENQNTAEPTAEGELFVSSLKSMLATHLENFGQVNDGILGLWAGPEHWRKKAKRRRLDEFGNVAAQVENEENVTVGKSARSRCAKKTKKTSMDYAAVLLDTGENRSKSGCVVRGDWSKQLEIYTKASGKSPVLREQNRRLAGERFNLLPPSIADARQNIYELFNREVMRNLVDKRTNETHENVTANAMADGGIVPPWLDSQEDEVHDDGDVGDMVANDDDDYDVAPYDGVFTQGTTGFNENTPTMMPLEGEDGVKLVAPPRQIARLEIGYARSAKLINVRHLKSVLWSMIESDFGATLSLTTAVEVLSPPAKKTRTSTEADAVSAPPSPSSSSSFSDLLTALPAKVSKQTAGELSVAIGLNCLLHLANEKDLFLETGMDYADLFISRGLPATELNLISQHKRCSHRGDASRSKKQLSLDPWLEEVDANESNV
ncbi:Condensin complex subunit 2 [Echinococcus multilocularis]|uniref:Condensin complex subunit 2 n=1 Tax=Echinococcus multilocularis TaxID=6211 RepID=A0A068YGG5_ECHMU|nr:Condensin complex subunit 2 [Echinococcus multilocularis]